MLKRLAVLAVLLCAGVAEAQTVGGGGIFSAGPNIPKLAAGWVPGAPMLLPDGAVGAPALAFAADATTGFYRPGAAQVSLGISGSQRFLFTATVFALLNDSAEWRMGNASDIRMVRDAAATLQFGADAATATAQTVKGPDSTGANIAGGNLTLRAGAGTAGNATGGNLILGGGALAGTGERGVVLIEDGGTKPTCAAGIRGAIWYDAGAAGVLDTLEVCRKDAANNYAWVGLF